MRLSRRNSIYLIAWLTDFAYMMFIFTVTRRLAEEGSSLFALGILGGATSFAYAISGSIAGRLSDRWGRRALVLTGVVAEATAFTTCALWPSKATYYFGAIFAGWAVGIFYPPLIAWMTEGKEHDHQHPLAMRTLFLFCIAWNVGVTCGQTTGGWLYPISPRVPVFGSAALVLIVLALAVQIQKPERRDLDNVVGQEPDRPAIPPHARTFAYIGWVSNVAGAIATSMILYLFPYLADKLNISPPIHGMMLGTMRVAVILTYSLMYFVTFWKYRVTVSLATQACAILGMLLLTLATTVPVLCLALMLVGVMTGYNYFASIFYSTTGFADNQKGMASAMHEASLAFGFAVGALGGGLLGGLGPRIPYLACTLAIVVAAIIQIVVYTNLRSSSRTSTAISTSR